MEMEFRLLNLVEQQQTELLLFLGNMIYQILNVYSFFLCPSKGFHECHIISQCPFISWLISTVIYTFVLLVKDSGVTGLSDY